MLPIVALPGLLLATWAAPPAADLIVENARIHTLNPAQPEARALAVANGRILAAGDDLSSYAGPRTTRLDLHGATVLPGLIDAHAHLRALGELLETRDLRHVKTIAEIAAYVRQLAAARRPGEWIVGRNWDQTNWGGQFPSARDLDAAAARHPVFLGRVDGHAAWVNSLALELAHITPQTPDPPGGKIIHAAAGRPTGVLVDAAQGLVRSKIPPTTAEQARRQLALAAGECSRLGLTTIHDAGTGSLELDAYRDLMAAGNFPLRIYAMIRGPGPLWHDYLRRGPEIGDSLTVRAIKLFADGALGSRGAALWQPYTDDPGNTGLLMLSQGEIEKVAHDALAHGFQVCTHAIGDRAVGTVLDAYAAALGGPNDHRFRIEHAQVVSRPDFQKFKDFSILPSMQPTHATSDMRWAAQRLGPDRLAGAYAWRRFLDLGLPVPGGSDTPVEEPNPMLGIYAAITRQDVAGNPPGGWMPEQRMTRGEALASFTLWAAYAAFEEHVQGSLEPGKFADFIVLDRDILSVPVREIPQTRVRMTFLGGKLVNELR
ncbi:MAG: amidohydrolase [Bryobacteraceae bacterium]